MLWGVYERKDTSVEFIFEESIEIFFQTKYPVSYEDMGRLEFMDDNGMLFSELSMEKVV